MTLVVRVAILYVGVAAMMVAWDFGSWLGERIVS